MCQNLPSKLKAAFKVKGFLKLKGRLQNQRLPSKSKAASAQRREQRTIQCGRLNVPGNLTVNLRTNNATIGEHPNALKPLITRKELYVTLPPQKLF